MSINLKEYLDEWRNKPLTHSRKMYDHFSDWENGVEDGKILMANELWKLLCFDLEG